MKQIIAQIRQDILLLALFIVPATAYAQTFSIDTISDAVFQRMQGKSYGTNCTVLRSELRYLRLSHYDPEGNTKIGELVCNKKIAAIVVEMMSVIEFKHKLFSVDTQVAVIDLCQAVPVNKLIACNGSIVHLFHINLELDSSKGLVSRIAGVEGQLGDFAVRQFGQTRGRENELATRSIFGDFAIEGHVLV